MLQYLIFLAVVVPGIIAGNWVINKTAKPPEPSPTPIVSPSPSLKIDPLTGWPEGTIFAKDESTPAPQVKNTYVVPSPIDPDPPIHCNVHPNCGGGTIPLKKSECDNSVCCQIGDKWFFYKDKAKCTQDQNNNYGSNTYNPSVYIPPAYSPIPYPSLDLSPTYEYKPYVPPSPTEEEISAALEQIQRQIDLCKSQVNSDYNEQSLQCSIRFGASSAEEACKYAVNQERERALRSCEAY